MADHLVLVGTMVWILAAWGALFAVLVGIGLVVRRAVGAPAGAAPGRLTDFWIGWAVLAAMLQLWHLWFAVDWRALVVATLVGMGGWVWNARDLLAARRGRPSFGLWLAVLLVAALLANQAIGPPLNYDSGRYHLQSIRWAASYPIVPGLGNLRRQFSLNSSYFLYVAMLDVGWWQHRSQHLANGLLLLALFAQIFVSARALLISRLHAAPIHVFWMLLLAAVLDQALGRNVSSPSPDLAVFALGVVVASQMITLLMAPRSSDRERAYPFLGVVILASVGITVKLSFAALGAVIVLVAFVVWRAQDDGPRIGRIPLFAAAILALVLGSWMARSIIISGYPVYPIGVAAAPVAWRLPASTLAASRAGIQNMSRNPILGVVPMDKRPRGVVRGWGWAKRWLRVAPRNRAVTMPWSAVLVAAAVALYCRWRDPQPRPGGVRRGLFFVAPAAAIVFWFVTAPDPRFVSASFAVLGPAMFAVAFERHAPMRRTILFAGAVLTCSLTLFVLVRTNVSWIAAGPDGGLHPLPTVPTRKFVTHSGLELQVPPRDQCWDGPLTCTASPQRGLRLRQANVLESGFVVDLKHQ